MSKIVVVNDNMKRLRGWERALKPVEVIPFTHPNFLATELRKYSERYADANLYLLDRMFYGQDLIQDQIFREIKSLVPKKEAKFVVTSGMHTAGDKVPGYDYTLPGRPLLLKDLNRILSKAFGRAIVE